MDTGVVVAQPVFYLECNMRSDIPSTYAVAGLCFLLSPSLEKEAAGRLVK